MDTSSADPILASRAELRRIRIALEHSPVDLDSHINTARTIIRTLDASNFTQTPVGAQQLSWFISNLQHIAYQYPDDGGVSDIAEWCVGQWLRLLQSDPENLEALKATSTITDGFLTDAAILSATSASTCILGSSVEK
ncbi:MAG: hypothetical protein Q9227_007298 [Pyrenula ochraceoflavens]